MKFSELFLSIFRKRLLFIAILASFAVFASILLWRFYANRRIVLSGEKEEASVPLSIVVPDGAYGVRKTFVVKRVPRETLSQTISSVFVGDLVKIDPVRPTRLCYLPGY